MRGQTLIIGIRTVLLFGMVYVINFVSPTKLIKTLVLITLLPAFMLCIRSILTCY